MREDISFNSHGLTCRGWLYRPEGAPAKSPAIIVTHGFSCVKEQGLDEFARVFEARGFVVLVFDYRYLGASEGEPRGKIIPQEQHDDLRAALDWLSVQPFVDAERIGLWGTSYSGGNVLFFGGLDPRVKAVVAQVPAIDLAKSLSHLAGREGFAAVLASLAADHTQRSAGKPAGEIAVTAPPGEPCVLPGAADAWFKQDAPNWVNRTTLESVARMVEYVPASLIELIAPRPLLIIAAQNDALIPIADVRAAFARAGEPKKLIEYDCAHFDVYPGERCHEQAAKDGADWFAAHLAAA
jgi:fermentation-respiration switch protein FrsA (DUF1100 family)